MAQIPFDPRRRFGKPWQDVATSRLWRGAKATGRAVVWGGQILCLLVLAGGAALGGYSLLTTSGNILTSNDKVLVQLIAFPPLAEARIPRGQGAADLDFFAPRRQLKDFSPEESLYLARVQGLVNLGIGIFLAVLSLGLFFACWSEVVDALGFDSGGVDKPKT
jgi:hypothetical protein